MSVIPNWGGRDKEGQTLGEGHFVSNPFPVILRLKKERKNLFRGSYSSRGEGCKALTFFSASLI